MTHKIEINAIEAALVAAMTEQSFPSELANYDEFVEGLFKDMESPAASFHHATTGLSGEAGELLDASKKVWVYNAEPNILNIIEELGDLRYYYQQCLNMLGLTDNDIKAANIHKLRRRYPKGYTDQHAQARLDKQE
jgi:NTP pyrophosphatase (non-canonical NTP hydrolase)